MLATQTRNDHDTGSDQDDVLSFLKSYLNG